MAKRRRQKRRRHHTRVFIIGAGVSAACGITVANEILRCAILKLESVDAAKAERVHRLLRYLYPNFDRQLRNYPNIEDFLNLLEMAKRFNSEEFIASTLWSKRRLDEVRDITLQAVTDYIWSQMADSSRQQVLRDFVNDNVQSGDTMITFNWDLTLERALESYRGNRGFLYTYANDRKDPSFSLLKPHGSIDWFDRRVIAKFVPRSRLGKLDRDERIHAQGRSEAI